MKLNVFLLFYIKQEQMITLPESWYKRSEDITIVTKLAK